MKTKRNDSKVKKPIEKKPQSQPAESYSIVMVPCATCGKEHEQVVEDSDRERALKHDVFICEECSGKDES